MRRSFAPLMCAAVLLLAHSCTSAQTNFYLNSRPRLIDCEGNDIKACKALYSAEMSGYSRARKGEITWVEMVERYYLRRNRLFPKMRDDQFNVEIRAYQRDLAQRVDAGIISEADWVALLAEQYYSIISREAKVEFRRSLLRTDEVIDIDEVIELWDEIAAPPGIQKFMAKLYPKTIAECKKDYSGAKGADLLDITRFSAVTVKLGQQNEKVFLVVAPRRCLNWLWGSARRFWFVGVTKERKLQLLFYGPYHGVVIHNTRSNGYSDISAYYGDHSCQYRFDGKEYDVDHSRLLGQCNR